MYSATVGFDVDRYAGDQFQYISKQNGNANILTKGLRFLVSLTPKVIFNVLGLLIGSAVVKLIQRDIRRIKQSTLIFRSLRDELRASIAETGVSPSPRVLSSIDVAQSSLVKLRSTVKTACFVFRESNEESRVAAAFEALSHEINDLMSAVYRFRLVAIGADLPERSWEETTAASHENLLAAAASIDDMSEDGIDPEIYRLSLAVIQQAERKDH